MSAWVRSLEESSREPRSVSEFFICMWRLKFLSIIYIQSINDLNSSKLTKAKSLLYAVMVFANADLRKCFEKEIRIYQCVPETDRAFYWTQMLVAFQAVHNAGINLIIMHFFQVIINRYIDKKPNSFLFVGSEIKLNITNTTRFLENDYDYDTIFLCRQKW